MTVQAQMTAQESPQPQMTAQSSPQPQMTAQSSPQVQMMAQSSPQPQMTAQESPQAQASGPFCCRRTASMLQQAQAERKVLFFSSRIVPLIN